MRMKMKRKGVADYNASFNKKKIRPKGMIATEWNSYLDELKRQGKYNGEGYAKTRTRIDEIFEVNQDIKDSEY